MKKLLSLLAIAAMALAGCSGNDPIDETNNPDNSNNQSENQESPTAQLNEYVPIDMSANERIAITDANRFAWKVFSAAESDGTLSSGNDVISPLSLQLCLSLIANASGDDTRAEILAALGVKYR